MRISEVSGLQYPGVDAVGERGQDGLAFRVVTGEFGLHVATEEEQARGAILFDEARPELCGHFAFTLAAPQIQLPQAVARSGKALGEEQVILVLRINVGHAVLVPDDIHGLGQPGHIDGVFLAAGRGAAGQYANQPTRQQCGDPAIKKTHGFSSGL
ncbi:hypothetical protein G6F31_018586 [Rhizopus arrhizus]|nr:hypothetical protein G6F31_018586 [Rhizopus arrhizus]